MSSSANATAASAVDSALDANSPVQTPVGVSRKLIRRANNASQNCSRTFMIMIWYGENQPNTMIPQPIET